MSNFTIIYCFSLFIFYNCNRPNLNDTTIDPKRIYTEKEQLIVSNQPIDKNSNEKDSREQLSDSLRCNIIIVLKTDKKMGALTSSDIKMFLNTFSKGCSSSIEYTEYSN